MGSALHNTLRFTGLSAQSNFAKGWLAGMQDAMPEIIRGISTPRRLRRGLMASSVLALGLVSATAIPAHAADLWTGTNSTDWFNAGNWAAGVPTNATSTQIDTVAPNA
ncbi:MAG: hypothetical protein M3O03_00940, partial [Pseudomonadota bacterium]|nr:hypothetical protein [Pseudomonadota bacterium]